MTALTVTLRLLTHCDLIVRSLLRDTVHGLFTDENRQRKLRIVQIVLSFCILIGWIVSLSGIDGLACVKI